jgi:STE24 endopeptidase
MNEDKATRYHRLDRQARLLSLLCTAAVFGGLLVTGGSGAMRDWAVAIALRLGGDGPLRPAAAVALYVAFLAVLAEGVALPLSFYRSFLLERRYGLSTETAARWLEDHANAGVLGLAFAELGAGFVYATLRHWPDSWWLTAATGYALARIGLVRIGPVLLLPLFYRFKPLERQPLRERLVELARAAGTPVLGAYEWKLGDRTRKANAALAGLGRTRRILVSDTLLAEYSDEEIEVILAHELAHHMHRDIWSGLGYDTLLTFAGFYVAHRVLQAAAPALGLHDTADVAGAPVLLLAAGALTLLGSPLANALSRAHERRADRTALRLTRNPGAFISAMRRLGQQNLAEESPSRLVQALFYTHPPVKERLRAAHDWPAAIAP